MTTEPTNEAVFHAHLLGARLQAETEREKKKKRPYHMSKRGEAVKKRAAHLVAHQWKKGQSGNPKGRPVKNLSIVSLLKEYLEYHPEDAQEIALALISLAKSKNLWAIESVMNRVDGKVAEVHHVEGELPVTIQFVPALELLSKSKEEVAEEKAREEEQRGQLKLI